MIGKHGWQYKFCKFSCSHSETGSKKWEETLRIRIMTGVRFTKEKRIVFVELADRRRVD